MVSLKELREAAGLTQVQLAESASLSESTIQKLERSEVLPGYNTLRNLAAVLGHDVFDVEFTGINRRFRGKQSTQEKEK